MEQVRKKEDREESGTPSQLPTQPLESEGGKTLLHPSGATVQTGGGAYIDGPVENIGGVNIFGVLNITDNHPSTKRPTSYCLFKRNTLFQPRPGEFEHLERLLLRREAPKTCEGTSYDLPTVPPKHRDPVGVTGMGGIGKTHLAVEFAYRYKDCFSGGIFWMVATGKTLFDWQRQLANLAFKADYLPADDDVSNPENVGRRARHLCRYLAQQDDALLILDNVKVPELVTTALPDLAGGDLSCAILYTSRVTKAPDGVIIHSVEQLPEQAALRLLLEGTRPALLEVALASSQSEEACAARRVCEIFGYLPLAVVHLRGLLTQDRRVSLVRVAEVLKERGVLNIAEEVVTTTFQLSWQQVQTEEARRMFLLAACLPEAAPIPLWLLGLAASLGEKDDSFSRWGRHGCTCRSEFA